VATRRISHVSSNHVKQRCTPAGAFHRALAAKPFTYPLIVLYRVPALGDSWRSPACLTTRQRLWHDGQVTIVFDMDNTLVDSFGASVRPGIVALLEKLRTEGHRLILWMNSGRKRAEEILRLHDLRRLFRVCVFREDYDPNDRGIPKDIRKVRGDLLIDDDPAEIAFTQSVGRKGYLIRPYRGGRRPASNDLARLYQAISKTGKLFGLF